MNDIFKMVLREISLLLGPQLNNCDISLILLSHFTSVPGTHLKNTLRQGWRKITAEILIMMKKDPGVTQQILIPDLITVTSQNVKVRIHIKFVSLV